jgi:anhydro-N-acetylmuramic acid kinase
LDDPYFDLPPPKSTGRDLFHAGWLAARSDDDANSADVMATLAELTAASAVLALNRYAPRTKLMLVCGGGAHNRHLMNRLARLVGAGVTVQRTAEVGVPPDQVEALAFAWLAQRFVNREPGNLPAVTGARGARRSWAHSTRQAERSSALKTKTRSRTSSWRWGS